ncbi:hypothetical protein AYO45_02110 [Gammaproteobacteria bacterium SCGC AG-212-F23]|nr:hypothetical protein AYO45_02110 [Gammaproteobacteria bacterium SCGC AG-212-F23]
MTTYLKAGILGGLVLFFWGYVSWMYLPWHSMTLHRFTDEKAVSQVIQANAPHSGVYLSPMSAISATTQSAQPQPMLFVSAHLQGMSSMVQAMMVSILIQFFSAILVAWMLCRTKLSYLGRLGFVEVFALTVGIVAYLPGWNWFKIDTLYTLVNMADLLVGWFLAGLLLAWICKCKEVA